MKKVLHTKSGLIVKELTETEIKTAAANGDMEAKFYLAKSDFAKALTVEEKINALAKVVGLL